jgi:hypothetical protein
MFIYLKCSVIIALSEYAVEWQGNINSVIMHVTIYGILQNNCYPGKWETMVMDWSYPKETHWIHREVCMRLETPGGLKARIFQKDLK